MDAELLLSVPTASVDDSVIGTTSVLPAASSAARTRRRAPVRPLPDANGTVSRATRVGGS